MLSAREIQQADILRLESEMNNLWGELNTCNIPHSIRTEMESKLSACEEQLRAVLRGQASFKDLETNLQQCDKALALATIQQAENELPKSEHTSSCFLALENLRNELAEGHLAPVRARHHVKTIMRPHS